jgi:hypothetical protein
MSKFDYRPTRINFGLLFIFTLVLLYVSSLSTQVQTKNDNFYSVLTSTCCTVLYSTFTYYICTLTQYIYYEIRLLYKKYKNQKIVLNTTVAAKDDTLQYRISSLMLDSMDITNSSTNRSIFISRFELWRIFYILPFIAIVVFFIIPMYDSSSTIAFCAGLFVKGMYDEFQKDLFWNRPVQRKVVYVLICITGFSLYILIFFFSIAITGISTANGVTTHDMHYKDNFTHLIYENGTHNISMDTLIYSYETEQANHSYTDTQNLHDILGYYQQYTTHEYIKQTPVLAQYINWSYSTYNVFLTVSLLLCFFSPFLIFYIPTTLSIPVVIEILQLPVTTLCCILLCLVSLVTDTVPFSLLKTSSALGDLFFITSGPLIWIGAGITFHILKYKKANSLAYVISPIAFIKICILNPENVTSNGFKEIVFTSAFLLSAYVLLSVYFDRQENISIRSGWGTVDDEDDAELGDYYAQSRHNDDKDTELDKINSSKTEEQQDISLDEFEET